MSITIDDFGKVEMRIGTVLEAIKVPDADRLIKLIFDFGPMPEEDTSGLVRIPELLEKYPGRDVRQIMSAIAPYIPDPSALVGKQISVVTNLEPRKFRGYESQGMIMATDDEEGIVFLSPARQTNPGSKIH